MNFAIPPEPEVNVRNLTPSLAEKILETSEEGIIVCDAESRIVWVNPAFTAMTGFSAGEAIGTTPRILHSGVHDAAFYGAMWSSITATGRWQGEVWNRRRDREIFPAWLSLHVIRGESWGIDHYIGRLADLSNQQALHDTLHHMAYFDAVTRLPNRNLFSDRLQQALLRAGREKSLLAVLFLDLDDFKTVNDTHGHAIGDRLLSAVAERLTHCMREGDTLSRFGGDEFVAVLPGLADETVAAQVAERIIHALEAPFRFERREFAVAASIGISLFPCDGKDASTLVRYADMAMYRVKDEYGNGYRFFQRDDSVPVRT